MPVKITKTETYPCGCKRVLEENNLVDLHLCDCHVEFPNIKNFEVTTNNKTKLVSPEEFLKLLNKNNYYLRLEKIKIIVDYLISQNWTRLGSEFWMDRKDKRYSDVIKIVPKDETHLIWYVRHRKSIW